MSETYAFLCLFVHTVFRKKWFVEFDQVHYFKTNDVKNKIELRKL